VRGQYFGRRQPPIGLASYNNLSTHVTVHTIVQLLKETCKLHWVKMHPYAERISMGGIAGREIQTRDRKCIKEDIKKI
jgi:hypothetical protein